ncbi:MAG: argD [Francisellaceae bacterium]|nr:argD [Francisellaceae bacterium]
MSQYLLKAYSPMPYTIHHGKGSFVWDDKGNKFLDAISSMAVMVLGHAHPKIVQAINHQASLLIHCSNLFTNAPQKDLAKLLCELTQLKGVFFSNSGTEANETAIKIARLYGHFKGYKNPKIIVMEGAFHGRTLATLSASSNPIIQKGYSPLVEGFIRVPFNDLTALETISNNQNEIAAILVEPIQGEGGIQIPQTGYLKKLSEFAEKNQWLLMVDEIQSGMGRTGYFLASQHENFSPDVVTLAKGLANGLPIGACLVGTKAYDLLTPGSHGSTFGGNPLITSVALATISTLLENNLFAQAAVSGEYLIKHLKEKLKLNPHVLDIRGQGLMIGIELDKPCKPIIELGLHLGIIINVTREKIIRILPPLNIELENLDLIVNLLPKLIDIFYGY